MSANHPQLAADQEFSDEELLDMGTLSPGFHEVGPEQSDPEFEQDDLAATDSTTNEDGPEHPSGAGRDMLAKIRSDGAACIRTRDALREAALAMPLAIARAYLRAIETDDASLYAVPITSLSPKTLALHQKLAQQLLKAAGNSRGVAKHCQAFARAVVASPLATTTLAACAEDYFLPLEELKKLSPRQRYVRYGSTASATILPRISAFRACAREWHTQFNRFAVTLRPWLAGIAHHRAPHSDRDDLAQEAWISVQRGLDLFSAAHGARLESYLYYWVNLGLTNGSEMERTEVRLRHSSEWRKRGLAKDEFAGTKPSGGLGTIGPATLSASDPSYATDLAGLPAMYERIFGGLPESINHEPMRAAWRHDHLRLLHRVLLQLPVRQRQALVMYFGLSDGVALTYQEVAEHIGGSRQNVQVLISNGIESARKALQSTDRNTLIALRRDFPHAMDPEPDPLNPPSLQAHTPACATPNPTSTTHYEDPQDGPPSPPRRHPQTQPPTPTPQPARKRSKNANRKSPGDSDLQHAT